jgi:hypothetical protein
MGNRMFETRPPMRDAGEWMAEAARNSFREDFLVLYRILDRVQAGGFSFLYDAEWNSVHAGDNAE